MFQLNCSLQLLPHLQFGYEPVANPLTRRTYLGTITQCTEASNHNHLGKLHSITLQLLSSFHNGNFKTPFMEGNKTHFKFDIYLSQPQGTKVLKDAFVSLNHSGKCCGRERCCQDQQIIKHIISTPSPEQTETQAIMQN